MSCTALGQVFRQELGSRKVCAPAREAEHGWVKEIISDQRACSHRRGVAGTLLSALHRSCRWKAACTGTMDASTDCLGMRMDHCLLQHQMIARQVPTPWG